MNPVAVTAFSTAFSVLGLSMIAGAGLAPLMKRIQAAWRASTEWIAQRGDDDGRLEDVRALAGVGGHARVLQHLRGGLELVLVGDRVAEVERRLT